MLSYIEKIEQPGKSLDYAHKMHKHKYADMRWHKIQRTVTKHSASYYVHNDNKERAKATGVLMQNSRKQVDIKHKSYCIVRMQIMKNIGNTKLRHMISTYIRDEIENWNFDMKHHWMSYFIRN